MDTRAAAERPAASLGLLFGALSALGPLAIDFYLPALPVIARDLGCSAQMAQLTLAVFFLALAFGPSLYGPMSDRRGRLPLLYCALAVFVVGSLGCAVAPDVRWLIVARFVQGLGGCGTTVMARAMIRDVARGHEAARLLALAFLVQGVSPLLAPVLGGALLLIVPWRALFLLITAVAAIVSVIVIFTVDETLPLNDRRNTNGGMLHGYGRLLANRRFVGMSLVAGCSTAGAFSFLTVLPFLLSSRFAFGPTTIGVTIAVVAGSQILLTQICPRLLKRWQLRGHLIRVTSAGLVLAAFMILAAATDHVRPVPFLVLVAALFGVYGLLLTPGAVGALDAAPERGGSASALLGTLQLLCAASASIALSNTATGSLWPIACATALCTGLAAAAAWSSTSTDRTMVRAEQA